MFLQQGHEVMAMAIKGVLLSELNNHCGGKHFAAPPCISRMRDNLNPRASSGDAGMSTIHHQHPLHPGKPSFGWEMGMDREWWWLTLISSLKLRRLFPCAAKTHLGYCRESYALGASLLRVWSRYRLFPFMGAGCVFPKKHRISHEYDKPGCSRKVPARDLEPFRG